MNKQRYLESFPESRALWYESQEDKDTALARIFRKTNQRQLLEAMLEAGLVESIERTCLEAVYWQGLTLAEAAKQLDLSPSDVKYYLNEATEKLKNYVKEHDL